MPNYLILIQLGETYAARMQPIRERHCVAIRYGIIFGAWERRLSQSETTIPWSWMIKYVMHGYQRYIETTTSRTLQTQYCILVTSGLYTIAK